MHVGGEADAERAGELVEAERDEEREEEPGIAEAQRDGEPPREQRGEQPHRLDPDRLVERRPETTAVCDVTLEVSEEHDVGAGPGEHREHACGALVGHQRERGAGPAEREGADRPRDEKPSGHHLTLP